jgi:glutathione S-transferase
MSLELSFHPLSSFCQKVLVALYENDTKFEGKLVNLMDPAERAAYLKVWPVGKFPVLRDGERLVPESSTIIEYLDAHYPGRTRFVPADAAAAAEARKWDRLFDLYLDMPLGKIVTDRMRPAGRNDPIGVEEARRQLGVGLDLTEAHMAGRSWAAGDGFTMADCAAAPALFYANMMMPFASTHPNAAAYLERLSARPSFARVLAEAQPYLKMVPKEEKAPAE